MTDLIGDYLKHHRPWRPVVDGNWRLGRDITAEAELVTPEQAAEEGRGGATEYQSIKHKMGEGE
jgi:hypothetical protein